jgi:hypothetical protein
MIRPPEWLYDLLPAFLRSKDVAQGEPLRALMSVLEMQYQAIESDLDRLYENWFVETCDEWVLPYIGDLLGLRPLSGARPGVFSLRGRVGNAIALRRRKGTLGGLAGAVRDGTGWAPHVVRYRDRVARSWSVRDGEPGQYGAACNHRLRSPAGGPPPSSAPALDGPWSSVARTMAVSGEAASPAELAGRSARRGRFDPAALGIYLWRLQWYPVTRGAARRLASPGTRFTANPFGIDQPMFWLRPAEYLPAAPGAPAAPAAPEEAGGGAGVPEPLGHTQLAAALDRAAGRHVHDGELPPVRVFVAPQGGEPFVEFPAAAIVAADLGSWTFPRHAGAHGGRGRRGAAAPRLAVDPLRGRLLFAEDDPRRDVRVSFGYGRGADLGGGGYPRRSDPLEVGEDHWEGVVSRDAPAAALPATGPFARQGEEQVRLYRSLEQALAAWIAAVAARPPGRRAGLTARVRILDSALYEVGTLPLALPPRCRRLVIEAAAGACPCVGGELALRAMAEEEDERPEVVLSGLWIDGRVIAGGPLLLRIEDSTVKPPAARAAAGCVAALPGAQGRQLEVVIRSSIVGPVVLPAESRGLAIADSIVDAGVGVEGGEGGGQAVRGPAAVLERTTFFGAVSVAQLQAASCLFTGRVETADPSAGWARYCYLPPGSSTPRCERCQPGPGSGDAVAPAFASVRFGDPGYARLSPSAPVEITAGGEDGSEIGAFHGLYEPQRRGNLPAVLEEFVPWGSRVFVEFVT